MFDKPTIFKKNKTRHYLVTRVFIFLFRRDIKKETEVNHSVSFFYNEILFIKKASASKNFRLPFLIPLYFLFYWRITNFGFSFMRLKKDFV